MNGRRQRLAWILLLSSFFICLGVVLATPLGISTFVQRSTRTLDVLVQANQGTVGILQNDNETGALFAGDLPQSLGPSGSIITNATDTALVLVQTPTEAQLLARVQVYGNSNVTLLEATTPRFGTSSGVHNLDFNLSTGRLQLSLPEAADRPTEVKLAVPQGEVFIREPGQYSIIASNAETQLAVLQGRAVATDGDKSLTLRTDQRGVLSAERPLEGPVNTERNLIRNGNFVDGLDDWFILAANVEISGQPTVEVGVTEVAGEPTLRISRMGIGHADSGLRQIIDQDVTDFDSLWLAVSMRVLDQTLGVCGEQGSECPLMVRIVYDDVNGVSQIWQQGFYAVGSVGPDTPDVCIACPPPLNEHQPIAYQQLVFYESANLLNELSQLGILPRLIKSVTLISSGHSFEMEVVDVALMAKE